MAKKKEGTITKTKDLTHSGSLTRTGEALPSVEELLGKKESPKIDNDIFLLKLKSPQRLEKILKLLNTETAISSQDKLSIVLGPYSKSQIVALCEAKLLTRRDELLAPQGNWKGVTEVIEEIKIDQLVSEDITSTASVTESITETASAVHIEVVNSETAKNREAERAKRKPVEAPQVIESEPFKAKVPPPPTNITLAKPTISSPNTSKSVWAWLAAAGIFIGVVTLWKFGTFSKILPSGPQTTSTTGDGKEKNWPESMREKDFDEIGVSRAPLVAKLDPILEAYERGAKVVSETDLRLLKVLAGPGSASLEARVTATNLLAALALSRSQTEEAKKLLDRLLEIVPTDSTTLLNRSLTYLVNREYKEAREVASTALRLCKEQGCWTSRAIIGFIAAEEGRMPEAEENFKAALEASRGNMWVMGLWLRSLKNAPKDEARTKAAQLLTETLVLDPDLMIDSPLRAPLATQVFLTEVIRGYRTAIQIAPESLTNGQKKYFEWLMSRFELNPLATSAQEALEILKGEAAALSQLAAAYLEKEAGRLDIAAEILSRTLARLSGTQIKSSWPWSFAGDIQRNRGMNDQAVIFYEGALNRNPRDVNAVFGLALILREKGDYKSAYQKMEEAISIDPNYVPVQLRRDRFEWERNWIGR